MRRSLKLATECGKSSIAVSYDLAIAKMALRIQAKEAPLYDNILIAIGAFHIKLAFFNAIGKYVEESGVSYILTEKEVLAGGSTNAFLKGKNYNRCKRLHGLFSVVMEMLHFESFLDQQDNKNEIVQILKAEFKNLKKWKEDGTITLALEVEETMVQYSNFTKDTEAGAHGKTAQFWMGYVKLIKLNRLFSRSIREGDLKLYINSIKDMTNLFFTFNHPNFTRWLVRYHDNLLKLEESQSNVYVEFKKGLFSLRRTRKSFSGSPVDLTLEQTINAEAASEKLGISHLTNSIAAQQRWACSHFLRTSVISSVLNELSISKSEDVSQELKPNRLKRDAADLEKIKEGILETMNPFSTDVVHDNLFNIASGKSATSSACDFLLNVCEKGREIRETFIEECLKDPKHFEEPITRQKVFTFATDAGKHKISGKDNQIKAIGMVRDLFGCILHLSLQKKIDMALVLTFPLTPVPLSLCHADGTMHKTPKSKLLKHLESFIEPHDPLNINVTIIDAMFFLHLSSSLPSTFGGISQYLLKSICCSKGKNIHFVFDKAVSPTIKDSERDLRSSSSRTSSFDILGPGQKRPQNWLEALRNDRFKESLVKYLINSWNDNSNAGIIQDKVLYANCGDVCYSYKVSDGHVVRRVEPLLCCKHEEADSRMIYHLTSVNTTDEVIIRTNDTDVLIIALGCFSDFAPGLTLWLEIGLYKDNSLRYISINNLFSKLGPTLCKALPGYHAFSGCDYSASFSRKGKIRPYKILEKNDDVQRAFGSLGVCEVISPDVLQILEKIVCQMYGFTNSVSINDVRLQIFLKKYRSKSGKPISSVKRMDGAFLPPCSRVLVEKIKRTNFIVGKWLYSTSPTLSDIDP